jgi:hypothetical protein
MKAITKSYLRENPDVIFVFGDNTSRTGFGGAAKLRNEPNTYGFITKKRPTRNPEDYYTVEEYGSKVYPVEAKKLRREMIIRHNKTFLISKLGAGLANKFGIFEKVIKPNIREDIKGLPNVKFLW